MAKNSLSSVRQQIILLNNDGIASLQMGKINEACSLLTQASSILGRMSNNSAPSRSSPSQRPISYSWIDFSTDSFVASFSDRKLANEISLPLLFLRTLRISSDVSCSGNGDICPLNLCWAVLYNLAISCHLLACQLGQTGNQHLRRAHELYEIVRSRFLAETPLEHRATVALALFNNAGYIYREFGMHEQSVACLGKARDMLAHLPGERLGADWKLFGINLMLLQQPTIADAA
jgi:tetratricopeptide (TPR) repeat protein